eukprot:COSAG02_NODE_32355_length_517_cov_1.856459_1_plen_142_part_10
MMVNVRCAGCGKGHGAVYLDSRMCEGCGVKHASYGTSTERKRRWCAGCGKGHGAEYLSMRSTPVAATGMSRVASSGSDGRGRESEHAQESEAQGQEAEDGEEEEEEQAYEVERVLDVRRRRGLLQYKVKWVGYDATTWEEEA